MKGREVGPIRYPVKKGSKFQGLSPKFKGTRNMEPGTAKPNVQPGTQDLEPLEVKSV